MERKNQNRNKEKKIIEVKIGVVGVDVKDCSEEGKKFLSNLRILLQLQEKEINNKEVVWTDEKTTWRLPCIEVESSLSDWKPIVVLNKIKKKLQKEIGIDIKDVYINLYKKEEEWEDVKITVVIVGPLIESEEFKQQKNYKIISEGEIKIKDSKNEIEEILKFVRSNSNTPPPILWP